MKIENQNQNLKIENQNQNLNSEPTTPNPYTESLSDLLFSALLGPNPTPEALEKAKHQACDTVYLTQQLLSLIGEENNKELEQKLLFLIGEVKLNTLIPKTPSPDFTLQAKTFTPMFQEFLTLPDPPQGFDFFMEHLSDLIKEIDPKLHTSILNYTILYLYETVSPDSDSDFVGYELNSETFNPEEFVSLFYPEDPFTPLYIEETIKVLSALPSVPTLLIQILQEEGKLYSK